MNRPLILVTNDDGIISPGISALVEVASTFGDVVVCAPDSPQSGKGHAITLDIPLYVEETHQFEGIKSYQCSGTPADCVKLAMDKLLPRKPDLCLSGINHGSNSSINVIYSGTMSAAMEGGINGIASIGFSLLDYNFDANFEASKVFIAKIIEQVLTYGLPTDTLLNVNIPKLPLSAIKGIKICRQAIARWVEDYDARTDPRGKQYFWLTGRFENLDHGLDTDEWALDNGYISVVPVHFDFTAHHGISYLNSKWQL